LITEMDPDNDNYCVVMTEDISVSAAFGRDSSTRKISLMTDTSKKSTHSRFVLWSKNAEDQPESIDSTPCDTPKISIVRLLNTGPVFLRTQCRGVDGNDDAVIHETGFYGVAKKKLVDLLSVVTEFSVKNDVSEEDEGDEDDEEYKAPEECYETVTGGLKIIQKAGQFIVRAAQPICPDPGMWDCKLDGSATLSEWTVDPKTLKMKKLSSKPLKLKPVSDCED
jgi:hypothetical protein